MAGIGIAMVTHGESYWQFKGGLEGENLEGQNL